MGEEARVEASEIRRPSIFRTKIAKETRAILWRYNVLNLRVVCGIYIYIWGEESDLDRLFNVACRIRAKKTGSCDVSICCDVKKNEVHEHVFVSLGPAIKKIMIYCPQTAGLREVA